MSENEKSLFGLKADTIRKINEVFVRYPHIEKVLIYGSRAKGNFKNGSDIDLTLVGENLNLEILLINFDHHIFGHR